MKKTNKIKEFFKDYGSMFKSFYEDLAERPGDAGTDIICHFIAWVGTAALTMATVTCIGAAAVLPAVLFGLGTASLATDEVVHITKKEPSFIVRSLMNVVSAVLGPPVLAVAFPLIATGAAISNAISNRREARYTAELEKDNVQETVQTHSAEMSASPTHYSAMEADHIITELDTATMGADDPIELVDDPSISVEEPTTTTTTSDIDTMKPE